jgi:hypothetical protein
VYNQLWASFIIHPAFSKGDPVTIHRIALCGGVLAALLALASVGAAQETTPKLPAIGEAKTPPPPPGLPTPPGIPQGGNELITDRGLERLKLSKEQSDDYDKINEEFRKKNKEINAAILESARTDPTKVDPKKVRELLDSQQKLRPDYLAKVEKILTDDQKKAFEEVRRESPAGVGRSAAVRPTADRRQRGVASAVRGRSSQADQGTGRRRREAQ